MAGERGPVEIEDQAGRSGKYRIRGLGATRWYPSPSPGLKDALVTGDATRLWSADLDGIIERLGPFPDDREFLPDQVYYPLVPKHDPVVILSNGVVIHKAGGGFVATAPAKEGPS